MKLNPLVRYQLKKGQTQTHGHCKYKTVKILHTGDTMWRLYPTSMWPIHWKQKKDKGIKFCHLSSLFRVKYWSSLSYLLFLLSSLVMHIYTLYSHYIPERLYSPSDWWPVVHMPGAELAWWWLAELGIHYTLYTIHYTPYTINYTLYTINYRKDQPIVPYTLANLKCSHV